MVAWGLHLGHTRQQANIKKRAFEERSFSFIGPQSGTVSPRQLLYKVRSCIRTGSQSTSFYDLFPVQLNSYYCSFHMNVIRHLFSLNFRVITSDLLCHLVFVLVFIVIVRNFEPTVSGEKEPYTNPPPSLFSPQSSNPAREVAQLCTACWQWWRYAGADLSFQFTHLSLKMSSPRTSPSRHSRSYLETHHRETF